VVKSEFLIYLINGDARFDLALVFLEIYFLEHGELRVVGDNIYIVVFKVFPFFLLTHSFIEDVA
jgi:hypothetical protein